VTFAGDAGPEVRLEGIRRAYREGDRERVVFAGLDAVFAPGELTLLFGRSGSGKSTLLNLISGIDRPDAGQVVVGGRRLDAVPDRERTRFRRRHMGFVFQFFNLVPTLTVEENLLLPLELNGLSGAPARERVAERLAWAGLGDRAGDFPHQLSGGEQQRVAVLRALVHEPGLILADEPTGNLDAANGGRILELLSGLTRERGQTLVMVTHSEEALPYADRVLELRDGRVAPRGGA
jgi:putative ABC transport system ATP-binding protein